MLEHDRNPRSFMRLLVLTVHLFIIVAVFLSIEIYESTMGEYKHTQQALTIGLSGLDGEGLVMGWMVETWVCGG